MTLTTAILAIHAVLFVIALVFICISSRHSARQKIFQILFSLLLPILGPLLSLAVHVSDRLNPKKMSDRYVGQSIDESPQAREAWMHFKND